MEQDWNYPNQENVRGDLCSEDGINALGSWCYSGNHPHAMESVVAIHGTNVVVQIVSSILDKLTRVCLYGWSTQPILVLWYSCRCW